MKIDTQFKSALDECMTHHSTYQFQLIIEFLPVT